MDIFNAPPLINLQFYWKLVLSFALVNMSLTDCHYRVIHPGIFPIFISEIDTDWNIFQQCIMDALLHKGPRYEPHFSFSVGYDLIWYPTRSKAWKRNVKLEVIITHSKQCVVYALPFPIFSYVLLLETKQNQATSYQELRSYIIFMNVMRFCVSSQEW